MSNKIILAKRMKFAIPDTSGRLLASNETGDFHMCQTGFLEKYADRWSPEPNTGCWLWFGSQTKAGYGNGGAGGVYFLAHRRSFEDENGEGSASGLIVRHRCDTPWCINPEHLLGGTQADNARDMIERGRQVVLRGEQAGRAVISETTAIAIREMAPEMSATEIAGALGVDRRIVYSILQGVSWKHLGGKVVGRRVQKRRPPTLRGEDANGAVLSEHQAREIKQRALTGERGIDLALEYRVSPGTISSIKVGRIWAWL